jgi:hypothetical protein
MHWESISMPKSAHALLDKAGVRPFSKVQALTAILWWFARLPLGMRIAMIHQYLLQSLPQPHPKGDACNQCVKS